MLPPRGRCAARRPGPQLLSSHPAIAWRVELRPGRWRRACGRSRTGMERGHAFTFMLLVGLGLLMLVPADGVGVELTDQVGGHRELPRFLRRWSSQSMSGTYSCLFLIKSLRCKQEFAIGRGTPLHPQTTVG